MRAERIHSIAQSIVRAYDRADIANLLGLTIQAVHQRVNNPADRTIDQKISDRAKALFFALDEVELRQLPPTWRKIMSELDLEVLQPDAVRLQVEEATRNQVVDSTLYDSLRKLQKVIAQKLDALRKLSEGFKIVGIGDDSLASEAVEVDIAMPRESIDDQLSGFNKELNHLNKELMVLSAISKSPTTSFPINSLSTNDFSIALSINVDLGEIIAFTLVALSAMRIGYRAKLDLLKDKNFSDLPKTILDQMSDWANAYVRAEIEKIVERLPIECPQAVDREKLERQKGPVNAALQYLEEKQELGFNVDVRVAEINRAAQAIEDTTDTRHVEANAKRERLAAIARKSAELKVLERQSIPVLSLTQKSDNKDANA